MDGGESSGATSLDIDEVAELMSAKIHYYSSLADTKKSGTSSCFIPKIQEQVRALDRAAYEPSTLSIGPYHHGNACLQTFQKVKWNCLCYMLSLNSTVKLHDYVNKIAELETKARNCYLGEMELGSSEFLQMLLLDGCFILVHLRAIDGLSRGAANSDKTEQSNTTQRNRESINEARSSKTILEQYDEKHESARMGQPEHTGTCSKGKDVMHALVTEDSEPNVEQDKVGQEKIGYKCSRQYQDAKWYFNVAYHDFLLLENQIPFFVVEAIYEVFEGSQDSRRLTDNIAIFVESILHMYPIAIQDANRPKHFNHLLHLCLMYFLPSQLVEQHKPLIMTGYFQGILTFGRRYFKVRQHQEEKEQDFIFHNTSNVHSSGKLSRWRRAEQYHEAGIEFKRRKLDEHMPHSLLDIRFHSGVLEVPFLFIDDVTGCRFRNLIALEQTSPHFGNDFTAYAAFIAQLISSPKDVSLLVKRGIVVHQMRTDEDVSIIFTRLLKNIDFDRNGLHYLRSTCIALEEHYQNRVNRWMAWLWQNHFSNPWLCLAVLAAILVLVCTILQLLFALLAYVNPVADISTSPNLNKKN